MLRATAPNRRHVVTLAWGAMGTGALPFPFMQPCSEDLGSRPYLSFQDLHPLLVYLLTGLQSLCGLQLGLVEPLGLSCQVPLVLGSQLLEPLGVGLFQLRHLGLEGEHRH